MPSELRDHFSGLSRDASRSPFTASLARTIAELPDVADLLAAAPLEQQSPVLLLAALHDQVLADPECALAAWYPTVAETPRTDPIGPTLAEHCRTHADELREVIARRHTQTNEVGRCGVFLPAIGVVAAEVGPIALVDVGTSAGLNLWLDHYGYEYEPGGDVGPASGVRLHVTTEGDVPVPAAVPDIRARIGIDPELVDPHDDAQVRWLRACVWPDQPDRFERLDAAIAIARAHADEHADLRRGDAIADLAAAVADAGEAAHPVVMNSWVLNYLSPGDRHRYVGLLDEIGNERDLSWVYAESPVLAAGLPFPDELSGVHTTALQLVRWRDGRRRVDHLATCHPHGYWLRWAT